MSLGLKQLESLTRADEHNGFSKQKRKVSAGTRKLLDVAHRSIIAGAENAPEAWTKLICHLNRKDELPAIQLNCVFYSVLYAVGMSMLKHFTEVVDQVLLV